MCDSEYFYHFAIKCEHIRNITIELSKNFNHELFQQFQEMWLDLISMKIQREYLSE